MSAVYDEFASVLLARKVISPEQLVEAWQLARRKKISLEDALVMLGRATPAEVAEARDVLSRSRYVDYADLLVWKDAIGAEQLAEARAISRQTGARLADTLVKLGYASEEQVVRSLAEFNGLQYVDLTEVTIPPAVVDLVPESVARENVVLPLAFDFDSATLKIITSDPSDVTTLQKLQFILNKRITYVVAPKGHIVEAINRHYGPSETESVDSYLASFTDTAIDFTETESTQCHIDLMLVRDEPLARQDVPATETEVTPSTPRPTQRRATVRYYSRMNPERLFPLLVILSRAEIEAVVKRGVRQAQSEAFTVNEGSLVEIEPVLPGCACHPPSEQVRVTGGEVSVTFWVVPQVLGRVMQARVVVRQEGDVLAEVPLDVCVVKQSLTRMMGALSLVLPFALFVLKLFGLDFESQQEEGFGLYAQAAGWLLQHLTPEVLTGLLLASTVGLYFWLRPRRREVFWDVKTRESAGAAAPVPSPAPAKEIDAEVVLSRAKQAFARGDEREGERLLAEVLSAKPLHTEALLCLAKQREQGEKYAMALVLYERVLASGRCMATVYFRASLAAHRSGDTARALSILKRAEAELPAAEMKGPLWYNMGCFAARLGRFPDALRYLNRAIDRGYDDLRWHAGFRRLLAEVER